ncbi:MAG: gamma-glutamyltransferase [Lachnospiraceae bacterium]|nr:gamma-glutamyltransferase [Lachnospiraceae bacterium]
MRKNQKQKRFLAWVLAAVMGLTMTACGQQPAGTTAVPAESSTAAETSVPAQPAQTEPQPSQTAPIETEPQPVESSEAPTDPLPASGVVTDGKGWYLWDESNHVSREGRGDTGQVGMVATAKYEASCAGMEILELGGNAIDAAVASAFALSVVEPNASGIGGGGHMLIYTADGQAHFLDFRGTAPAAATSQSWGGAEYGARSVTVPLEVEGLWTAYTNYGSGKVSWEQILAPAIRLAEEGYYITPTLYKDMLDTYDYLTEDPGLREIYLDDGFLYEIGDRLTNLPQAAALRKIAAEGPDGFYTGEIAEAIIETLDENGGLMTVEDLANRRVRELDVVRGSYRGYTILTTPFGGASVMEAMNILENFDVKEMGFGSEKLLNLYGELFQLVYRDRFDNLGDPDYADIPLDHLLSKAFAKARAGQIEFGTTKKAEKLSVYDYFDAGESQDTTHFSVADAEGNMVACTQTVNGIFGSKICVGKYGIVLNNVMAAFSTSVNSNNKCEPGKTPNSSMSPSMVLDPEGRPFLVLGSPGSRKIITTLTQILVDVLDFGMEIQEAVNQPRVFNDTERSFGYESRFDEAVIEALKKMGYSVHGSDDFDKIYGSVQAIEYKDGVIYGAADPRRDGKAIGY